MNTLCVVDLEATCWPGSDPRTSEKEIIEIGAVLFDVRSMRSVDEFQSFVQPVRHPTLSEFCKKLTSISQADMDRAETFPQVSCQFKKWIDGFSPALFSSWGDYDRRQLEQDCALHQVAYPFDADAHLNLKRHFASRRNCRPCGIASALRKLGISFQGTHHRALDDARMIVEILRRVGL